MSTNTYRATLVGTLMFLVSFLFLTADAGAQGINDPFPLKPGITSVLSLNQGERSHYKASLPAGAYKIILDSRRADEKSGNLISSLSILGRDGATLNEKAIRFNEIDVGYRRVHNFVVEAPTTFGFKLSNDNARATFWLTVLKEADSPPLTFFGAVRPKPFLMKEASSGTLNKDQSAYYIVNLAKGDYTVVLDLENSQGRNTNIQGYLALLNADGGGQKKVIGVNQIDVAYRKTAKLSFSKDEVLIIRVANSISSVRYTLKILPASELGRMDHPPTPAICGTGVAHTTPAG